MLMKTTDTLTATTITDSQIRELLARGGLTASQSADCEHALRKRDRHWTRFERNMQHSARSRCAKLLNMGTRCHAHGHAAHVGDVCEGTCCTTCGGPIDTNEECRC